MITNKIEYANCKAQVARQREEISTARKNMDALEILVNDLETDVLTSAEVYAEKPVVGQVSTPLL